MFERRGQGERNEHRNDSVPKQSKKQNAKSLAEGSVGRADDRSTGITSKPGAVWWPAGVNVFVHNSSESQV